MNHLDRYPQLADQLTSNGVDMPSVIAALKAQAIETPSWGYGDSGTRFRVFEAPDAAHTIEEKLRAAAQVHRLSGIAPSIALHIPWDQVDDWAGLTQLAGSLGIRLGAINPNVFQEEDYKQPYH